MNRTWVLEVKENSKKELYIELPPELTKLFGWKAGDRIAWKQTKTGWILKKIQNKKKRLSPE